MVWAGPLYILEWNLDYSNLNRGVILAQHTLPLFNISIVLPLHDQDNE